MYNILITSGETREVNQRDIYSAHLWVHNGMIKKNHIAFKSLKTLLKSLKNVS